MLIRLLKGLKKPAGIFVDAIRLSHLQVSAYFVNTQAEQLLYAAAGAFTFGYKPFWRHSKF